MSELDSQFAETKLEVACRSIAAILHEPVVNDAAL